MTCIGNSGDLKPIIKDEVEANPDMVFSSVLSGNRNFEGRVHPNTKANYLMAPIHVVAYALAGNIKVDFLKDPLGKDQKGTDVYLKDIFPSNAEIREIIHQYVTPQIFIKNYEKILEGNEKWRSLDVNQSERYNFEDSSTYIKNPPYFDNFSFENKPL